MARVAKNDKAVVVYLRVSTDEQGKSGLGLDAQLALCERVAEYEGLEVLETFTDIVSGKSDPMSRAGFKDAIALCQKHGARLMVAKLDRLSRDIFYVSSFCNGYMIKNCPKLIVAENPNASEFEINLRASLAQEERRLISERTKAALAQKKLTGCELGKVGRSVAVKRAQSSTEQAIARAKALRLDGTSLEEVANILNAEGFTTSRGSAWSKQALHKRLSA